MKRCIFYCERTHVALVCLNVIDYTLLIVHQNRIVWGPFRMNQLFVQLWHQAIAVNGRPLRRKKPAKQT